MLYRYCLWLHFYVCRSLLCDETILTILNAKLLFYMESSLRQLCNAHLISRMQFLTHCGRVTHICVSTLTIIGSDNGLLPGWRQAIIWTNAEILLIGHLGTNFSEILLQIYTFSFTKMHLKMSSGKWRPFCLAFNVLIGVIQHAQRLLCNQHQGSIPLTRFPL